MKIENGFEAVCAEKLSLSFTCRTCLNTNSNQQLTSIFDNTESSGKLSFDLVNQLSLLKLKIAKDDGYPENICNICMERLMAVDAFRKQCEKAQEYLERSDGCRLCLDPSAECFTTIDNPQLKGQMKQVFRFSIEPKQGYCSSVCQSCSYAISEFYQYSEKVRQNQEVLNGNATSCDSTVDVKITIESFKDKMLSNSGHSGMTENSCEPEEEVSKEEKVPTIDPSTTVDRVKSETVNNSELPETTESNDEVSEDEGDPSSGEDELYESPLQTQRKGCPEKNTVDDVEPDESAKNSSATITELIRQKRDEENQLFNKHFRMICHICGTSAETFTALHSHCRKQHQRNGMILCCNTKLYLRSAILSHIDFHANPDVFRCEVCGDKFTYKVALTRHKLRKHSSEEQRPFKCDGCPQSFALRYDLTKHMAQHVNIKCPKCQKMFKNKRFYDIHMTNQHGGIDRSIVCTICEKLFVTKRSFDRHMNGHMGVEVQRVQCGICQRWLKSKDTLRQHMDTVHDDGELKFQCNVCQSQYSNSRALQMHKLRAHVEPKHECEFCGKKFREATVLKEHRTIHTGELLYPCKYCGMPIRNRKALSIHIKRHHPTEWEQKRRLKNAEQS